MDSWFVTEVDTRYPSPVIGSKTGRFFCFLLNKIRRFRNPSCPKSQLSGTSDLWRSRAEQVTDSGMRQVCALSELESLTLQDARRLTGAGVAELAKLPRLRRLLISNAKFDDEAFEELSAAPHLKC